MYIVTNIQQLDRLAENVSTNNIHVSIYIVFIYCQARKEHAHPGLLLYTFYLLYSNNMSTIKTKNFFGSKKEVAKQTTLATNLREE